MPIRQRAPDSATCEESLQHYTSVDTVRHQLSCLKKGANMLDYFPRRGSRRRTVALAFVWLAIGSAGLNSQGTKQVTVRVIALNLSGKPITGLTAADIDATMGRTAVPILKLVPYAAMSSSGGSVYQDRLLYLFPPMQAKELAKRAKEVAGGPLEMRQGSVTLVAPDGQQTTAPQGSPALSAAVGRIAAKQVQPESIAQWQSVAQDAIRTTATATGRCVVLLNAASQHALNSASARELQAADLSIGRLSGALGCELYVVDDPAAMPSEIPPTFGEFKRGEAPDSSGQLQGITGPPVPAVSSSGEATTYSIKNALKDIQRDSAGVYFVSLDLPASCACPLQLTSTRGNIRLLFPRGGTKQTTQAKK